jgi:hypothetical protein
VPYDPPQLELKATYGLVKPEPLSMPAPSPLWNPASYAAFDTAMAAARDPKAVIKYTTTSKHQYYSCKYFRRAKPRVISPK